MPSVLGSQISLCPVWHLSILLLQPCWSCSPDGTQEGPHTRIFAKHPMVRKIQWTPLFSIHCNSVPVPVPCSAFVLPWPVSLITPPVLPLILSFYCPVQRLFPSVLVCHVPCQSYCPLSSPVSLTPLTLVCPPWCVVPLFIFCAQRTCFGGGHCHVCTPDPLLFPLTWA